MGALYSAIYIIGMVAAYFSFRAFHKQMYNDNPVFLFLYMSLLSWVGAIAFFFVYLVCESVNKPPSTPSPIWALMAKEAALNAREALKVDEFNRCITEINNSLKHGCLCLTMRIEYPENTYKLVRLGYTVEPRSVINEYDVKWL